VPPVKYYKQRIFGFFPDESPIGDPIELSEEQVKREIGCFFRDIFVILSQQPSLRVNDYRYWQE
jgi:hypothetical protein